MDLTEGLGQGQGEPGKTGDGRGETQQQDPLERLLAVVRGELGIVAGERGNNGAFEFDGIRSEVDFRWAMALEEGRRRRKREAGQGASWLQRALKAVKTGGTALLSWQTMRRLVR